MDVIKLTKKESEIVKALIEEEIECAEDCRVMKETPLIAPREVSEGYLEVLRGILYKVVSVEGK